MGLSLLVVAEKRKGSGSFQRSVSGGRIIDSRDDNGGNDSFFKIQNTKFSTRGRLGFIQSLK